MHILETNFEKSLLGTLGLTIRGFLRDKVLDLYKPYPWIREIDPVVKKLLIF